MFETLSLAPPDAILGLNEAFKRDSRATKVNLTVGVFQNEQGVTPILDTVRDAERRLVESEQSKSYLGIDGLPEFTRLVRELLLAEADRQRAVTLQTPGGTGALRVAADFLSARFPGRKVWCSDPTWANHPGIFQAVGLDVAQYRYLDRQSLALDFTGLVESLQQASPGDVVCLHACCHNPTGVDPTPDQWREVAALCVQRNLLPLVDCAYQGFGDGLGEDLAGLTEIVRQCPELLICSSYSKNFGLYSERVGALTLVAESDQVAAAALSHVKLAVRTNYSNPPRHGAALVATILADPDLRQRWEAEVAEMRNHIHRVRRQFVQAMRERQAPRDFGFLEQQRGMFSFSGLTPLQVDQLKQDFSVYIVGSGRINVAGLRAANLDYVCDAICQVLKSSQ